MNFCKGKIKNINKKIIVGALAMTLISTSLVGCTKDFDYEMIKKDNKYVISASGEMDLSTANNLKVIELEFDNQSMLFLARKFKKRIQSKEKKGSYKYICEYWDVFEDFKIFSTENKKDYENFKLVKEESFEDYLINYNYTKDDYTVSELKKIFEEIKEDYEKENNKKLIKE